jgi:F0F1-type ATP synthase gamma subunit
MRTGEREAHALLIYNRTRQAMIAKELIEIIPGGEAI